MFVVKLQLQFPSVRFENRAAQLVLRFPLYLLIVIYHCSEDTMLL